MKRILLHTELNRSLMQQKRELSRPKKARKRRKRSKMRKVKRMRKKMKRMRRKKMMMVSKLVLAQFFFFLVYKAFNPPVHNSLLLKKQKLKYKAV